MSIFEELRPLSTRDRRLRVAVLGCTGSVGSQTLDVCLRHSDKVEVTAVAVGHDLKGAAAAAREFGCVHVAIADDSVRPSFVSDEFPAGCDVRFGASAVAELCSLDDVDCVVNAVVGAAGIRAGHAALVAGKKLAYANKESIVVAGDIMMPLVRPGQLIPVDSEHSAIYQCIVGERRDDVRTLWLTCSGGPFYGKTREELSRMTASDALAHPTWDMGAKITIDSSTLMNKGLEVIEAHQLFGVGVDEVRVLVHRQSMVHSMVEFSDGVVKAQLGPADMRAPIQYALSYPDRWEASIDRVDWCHEPPMTFGEADEATFGCLALAKEAGRVGGTLPCAMNAANEVAVDAFLRGRCGFLDIERIVSNVMESTVVEAVETLEQLEDCDRVSRIAARRFVEGAV